MSSSVVCLFRGFRETFFIILLLPYLILSLHVTEPEPHLRLWCGLTSSRPVILSWSPLHLHWITGKLGVTHSHFLLPFEAYSIDSKRETWHPFLLLVFEPDSPLFLPLSDEGIEKQIMKMVCFTSSWFSERSLIQSTVCWFMINRIEESSSGIMGQLMRHPILLLLIIPTISFHNLMS